VNNRKFQYVVAVVALRGHLTCCFL